MEFLRQIIDWVLHLDKYLGVLINNYGAWTYGILFAIIFMETGLVVTPFLPGDSLLFAIGAIAASTGSLNVVTVFFLLTAAAILGDNVNYWLGYHLGPKVFSRESSWLLNRKHLDKTHQFYEKYGGKTIIIARFMPFVRTFAPFVAGIGRMSYVKFLAYSVGGGILWMGSLLSAGYFFGNIPIVKKNFTLVIFAIIFISILPGIIEVLRARKAAAA
ncbi:MAG: DedA family protein [Blastocatellia bacterium]